MQIFDQDEGVQMMKNYSSLMMKDSKFKDNSNIGGGTPFVQYLIKNNKFKASQENRRKKNLREDIDDSSIITTIKAKGQRSSTSFQDHHMG